MKRDGHPVVLSPREAIAVTGLLRRMSTAIESLASDNNEKALAECDRIDRLADAIERRLVEGPRPGYEVGLVDPKYRAVQS